MLKKVRVENNGGTDLLPGQLVDKLVLDRENARVKKEKKEQATSEPLILGITKASLATESFLSAASFQETTKVLTDAAIEGKVDRLLGLKENVIIGKLIPAATGLKRYRHDRDQPVRQGAGERAHAPADRGAAPGCARGDRHRRLGRARRARARLRRRGPDATATPSRAQTSRPKRFPRSRRRSTTELGSVSSSQRGRPTSRPLCYTGPGREEALPSCRARRRFGLPVRGRPSRVRSRLRRTVRHPVAADGLGRVRLADAAPDPRASRERCSPLRRTREPTTRSRRRARGAATYAFDLKLANAGRHADRAGRSLHARGRRGDAVPEGRGAHGRLRDAARRRERAVRRRDPDAVDGIDGAVPRERARSSSPTSRRTGAHPVLLVSKSPYLGSADAVAWWQAVAKVSDIVREVYLPATKVWPLGPILGNRLLRVSYRNAVTTFTSIGIPANRLGVMISFLSAKGVGGRNGLQPASAWYQVVKWEALAAKQVAKEIGLGSVFSWGWQEWNAKEMDPDKPKAACVWLWARTQTLCNAPKTLGKTFNRSLTDGQIELSHGTVCRADGFGGIGAGGDRVAPGADRRPQTRRSARCSSGSSSRPSTKVPQKARARGRARGHPGVVPRQPQRLSRGATPVARDARARARDPRRRDPPRAARAAAVRAAAHRQPRCQRSTRPIPTCSSGGFASRRRRPGSRRATGFALAEAAPQRVFSLPTGQSPARSRRSSGRSRCGRSRRRSLSAPCRSRRRGRRSSRRSAASSARSPSRTGRSTQQDRALNKTICLRDQLPQPAAIDLTEYLPFLRLQ